MAFEGKGLPPALVTALAAEHHERMAQIRQRLCCMDPAPVLVKAPADTCSYSSTTLRAELLVSHGRLAREGLLPGSERSWLVRWSAERVTRAAPAWQTRTWTAGP